MKIQKLIIHRTSLITILLIISTLTSFSQVQSGPMLGYSDMREVLLWVQTQKAASVKFVYWDKENPTKKFSTEEVKTEKKTAFVARCIADEVLPSKKYDYEVWVDKKKMTFNYPLTFQTQVLWQYRTDPPNFKAAVGSCFYVNEERFDRPGKGYGSDYEIMTSIYNKHPDLMIWGGDNLYMREPDWNTKTGMNYRYTHTRSLPELQPLLASTHHYAIWDDHDGGPNDNDRSNWVMREATETFKNFWGNPNYIFKDEGITGTFQWADVQFFMMDDRTWRAPNDRKDTGKRDFLGEKQLQWLIDALKYSTAPFKIVVIGGQVVNPAKIFEVMANYEEERQQMIDLITKEKIQGVMFLTGDRHHSCLQKLDRAGTYPLYDLTVSSFTAGSAKTVKEEANSPFVEGTIVEKHNFGILEFSGKRLDRVMKINIFDKDGKEVWVKEIRASELK